MGGGDYWFVMEYVVKGQCIEEEVDCMDMNEIGIGEVMKDLWCNRIVCGVMLGNVDNFDV